MIPELISFWIFWRTTGFLRCSCRAWGFSCACWRIDCITGSFMISCRNRVSEYSWAGTNQTDIPQSRDHALHDSMFLLGFHYPAEQREPADTWTLAVEFPLCAASQYRVPQPPERPRWPWCSHALNTRRSTCEYKPWLRSTSSSFTDCAKNLPTKFRIDLDGLIYIFQGFRECS